MNERHQRTKMLIGDEALERLQDSRVAVFGVGGVGGYAAEALARSGVGSIDLIDADDIAESNLNRQIVALTGTLGKGKAETAAERIADIDPSINITVHKMFYLPDSRGDVDFSCFDYVIDAVDTVAAKIDIIVQANLAGVPVISAMGCGNRLDPSKLQICDISKTFNDPLSKAIRRRLKDTSVKKLDVVFSTELPYRKASAKRIGSSSGAESSSTETTDGTADSCPCAESTAASVYCNEKPTASAAGKKDPPASMVFVPACAGLMMAGYVCRKLAGLL